MHTFCQIIHKITSETNQFYNYSTAKFDNSHGETYKFMYGATDASEYKINENISYEADIANRLLKTGFYIFASNISGYSIQSKFSYFKKTIDNCFLNEYTRTEFINRFCKIQRCYWALNKAAYNYKWRKAPYRVNSDLFLNPISETQHNVFTLMHNNNKYLFTALDLKNIIEGALCNSPNMFADPNDPKNPYNNIPFDTATLYNIYFFMKKGDIILSSIFHNFFLCNFNLDKFMVNNEVIIRKKYIQQLIQNADVEDLYNDGIEMLSYNNIARRLKISEYFPQKRFVEIMLPYLNIYYIYNYSLDISERNRAERELNRLLRRFYYNNPCFGRKMIDLSKCAKDRVSFNDEHKEFLSNKYPCKIVNLRLNLHTNRTLEPPINDRSVFDRLAEEIILNSLHSPARIGIVARSPPNTPTFEFGFDYEENVREMTVDDC
jgi:hypothetical protein